MAQCGEKCRFLLEGSVLEFAHSGIITPPHDFAGTRSFYLEEPFVSGEEDGTHSAMAEFSQDPITSGDQRTLTEVPNGSCSSCRVRMLFTGYNRRPDGHR